MKVEARTASQFELGDAGDDILKLAEAIKTDNQAAIKQLTKSLAKREYIEDGIMTVFKPRSKGGLGVGREKGKVTPDGIDLKLQAISLAAPSGAVLGREGPALEEMAYIMAAVAEVAALKGPPEGKQKKRLGQLDQGNERNQHRPGQGRQGQGWRGRQGRGQQAQQQLCRLPRNFQKMIAAAFHEKDR